MRVFRFLVFVNAVLFGVVLGLFSAMLLALGYAGRVCICTAWVLGGYFGVFVHRALSYKGGA